jgi:deoxyribonuclease-4
MQIFVKNANRWQQRPFTEEEIEAFHQKRQAHALDPVLAHASYLINVASPDRELRRRSEQALVDELERCRILGVDALVLHPGARMSSEPGQAIERAARVMGRALRRVPEVRLLLENTAGQGSLLGGSICVICQAIDSGSASTPATLSPPATRSIEEPAGTTSRARWKRRSASTVSGRCI